MLLIRRVLTVQNTLNISGRWGKFLLSPGQQLSSISRGDTAQGDEQYFGVLYRAYADIACTSNSSGFDTAGTADTRNITIVTVGRILPVRVHTSDNVNVDVKRQREKNVTLRYYVTGKNTLRVVT